MGKGGSSVVCNIPKHTAAWEDRCLGSDILTVVYKLACKIQILKNKNKFFFLPIMHRLELHIEKKSGSSLIRYLGNYKRGEC